MEYLRTQKPPRYDCAKLLIDDAKVCDYDKRTLLYHAVSNPCCPRSIVDLLILEGASVNSKPNNYIPGMLKTLLKFDGNSGALRALIEAGLEVDENLVDEVYRRLINDKLLLLKVKLRLKMFLVREVINYL